MQARQLDLEIRLTVAIDVALDDGLVVDCGGGVMLDVAKLACLVVKVRSSDELEGLIASSRLGIDVTKPD